MKALLYKASVTVAVALIIDQMTKVIVRAQLQLCTSHGAVGCERVELGGPAELIRIRNAGSAFGFLQDLWLWIPVALAGLTLVFVYARVGGMTSVIWLAAGLQVGGALGNLVDRALLGGVTDFIYLGAGPVFNVADIALGAGTVLASWGLRRRCTSPPSLFVPWPSR